MHGISPTTGKIVLLHALVISLASIALCGSRPPSSADPGIVIGDRWIHMVAAGETWQTIGARVGVAPAVLAARNHRTLRAALRPGDVVAIDNRHVARGYTGDGLVINVPQRMLFHYWGGALRARYPVAVGRPDRQTPVGRFTVLTLEVEPAWDVPLSIQREMQRAGKPVLTRVPPGSNNPLGHHWIGLSLGSIGVHGTIVPASIYQFVSHGCVRLHAEDIDDLFANVAIGDSGEVVYEPVLVAFDGTDVFLEVHADAYHRGIDLHARAWQALDETGLRALVDPQRIARALREAEGLAVPVTAPDLR